MHAVTHCAHPRPAYRVQHAGFGKRASLHPPPRSQHTPTHTQHAPTVRCTTDWPDGRAIMRETAQLALQQHSADSGGAAGAAALGVAAQNTGPPPTADGCGPPSVRLAAELEVAEVLAAQRQASTTAVPVPQEASNPGATAHSTADANATAAASSFMGSLSLYGSSARLATGTDGQLDDDPAAASSPMLLL